MVFKFTHFLFHKIYWLYRFLYFIFKHRQDRQEIKLMKSYANKGDTIIDVGANIGFYAQLFSRWVGPNGKVYCFEPDTNNYHRLLQTTQNLNNVRTKNAAASNTTGQLEFYTSPDKNVDHRAYAPDTFATKYTVDCVRIDEFLGPSTKVNILKVDVQGFEMQVYKGLEKILAANPEMKIFSEFWPYGLQKAGSSKEEYFKFFTEKGFTIYLLKDNKETIITEASLKDFPISEGEYFNVFMSQI